MAKAYNSFIVRTWLLKNQPLGERLVVDVEHVQSGRRLRTTNFADVSAWMESADRSLESDRKETSGRARAVDRRAD
jgi:hypothetical protein